MSNDVDYQDMLDDVDIDTDALLSDEQPRSRSTGRGERDYRRAIEELREERRLRALLNDYDLDDDDDDL